MLEGRFWSKHRDQCSTQDQCVHRWLQWGLNSRHYWRKKKKKKHPNLVLSHAITQPSVQETIIFYGCSLSVPLSKRAAG